MQSRAMSITITLTSRITAIMIPSETALIIRNSGQERVGPLAGIWDAL